MQILRGVYVDSFRLRRPNSIHFLTHWHADHYMGIANKWQYGPIYCSAVTRKIMLTKYPKLESIATGLELKQAHTITNAEGIEFKVTMFDSNHIAGSVLLLFQLPDGKHVLHTGDMRFNAHCLQNNPELFCLDSLSGEYKCRQAIDTLYLDNTYCDPIFMFPNRSDALRMVRDIIDAHQPGSRRVYIVTDSIGKEEAFVGLALHYGTPVTLWGERMNYVRQMYSEKLVRQLFCTKQESTSRGSWIQVIKRKYVDSTLQQDARSIAIKLTGWANLQHAYPLSEREYIVPYSLHSNFAELELFMSVVRPRVLLPVVRISHNKSTKFRDNIHSYGSYFGSLTHMKQRGFAFFSAHYVEVGFSQSRKKGRPNESEEKRKQLLLESSSEEQNKEDEDFVQKFNLSLAEELKNQAEKYDCIQQQGSESDSC